MKRFRAFVLLVFTVLIVASLSTAQRTTRQSAPYYPSASSWETRKPEDVGMDSVLLAQAVEYAKSQPTSIPADFSTQVDTFGRVLGPLPKERGGSNGIVLRHGYIVAEWGDTNRIDPTYSVAKSVLSTIAGITVERGLIKNVKDPVKAYITDGGYDSAQNSKVTWEQHLQQTSEWEGTMWEKNSNFLGREEFGRGQRRPRDIKEPGTYWEYNDVRINRFSLSLLQLWKKSLPQVLKQEVMDPIGASTTWQYHPYSNSTVNIGGKSIGSVSGGTRWGGGLWINTRDEARFGYLFLRKGKWKNKQIVSEAWVKAATTPIQIAQDYGYLWWLNTARKQYPGLPESVYAAKGYGSNTILVDPEHDLVIVWRWHEDRSADEFFKRVVAAVK